MSAKPNSTMQKKKKNKLSSLPFPFSSSSQPLSFVRHCLVVLAITMTLFFFIHLLFIDRCKSIFFIIPYNRRGTEEGGSEDTQDSSSSFSPSLSPMGEPNKYVTYGWNLLKDFTHKNLETLFKTPGFLRKLLHFNISMQLSNAAEPRVRPFLFIIVDDAARLRTLCQFLVDHIMRQKTLSEALSVELLSYMDDADGSTVFLAFVRSYEGARTLSNVILRRPELLQAVTPKLMNTVVTYYEKNPNARLRGSSLITDYGCTTAAFCLVNNNPKGAGLLERYLDSRPDNEGEGTGDGVSLTAHCIGVHWAGGMRSILSSLANNKYFDLVQKMHLKNPDAFKAIDGYWWRRAIDEPTDVLVRGRKGLNVLYCMLRRAAQPQGAAFILDHIPHLLEPRTPPTEEQAARTGASTHPKDSVVWTAEVLVRMIEERVIIEVDKKAKGYDPKRREPTVYIQTCVLLECARYERGRELLTQLFAKQPALFEDLAVLLKSIVTSKEKMSPGKTIHYPLDSKGKSREVCDAPRSAGRFIKESLRESGLDEALVECLIARSNAADEEAVFQQTLKWAQEDKDEKVRRADEGRLVTTPPPPAEAEEGEGEAGAVAAPASGSAAAVDGAAGGEEGEAAAASKKKKKKKNRKRKKKKKAAATEEDEEEEEEGDAAGSEDGSQEE